jgi:hypothetical protein
LNFLVFLDFGSICFFALSTSVQLALENCHSMGDEHLDAISLALPALSELRIDACHEIR